MHTLVISPHIDDEVLGCAGMIYNRKLKGENVHVYYLGVENFHEVDRNIRLQEAKAVAEFLGFSFDIGVNVVNQYRLSDLVEEITAVIEKHRPIEIFIPLPSYNQDHKTVHDAAIVALRPHDRNYFVPRVYIYEVDQYQVWQPTIFRPNYFESIELDAKIQSYLLHKSQVREMRPTKMLEHYASIRGYSCGQEHAEGFITLRFIK